MLHTCSRGIWYQCLSFKYQAWAHISAIVYYNFQLWHEFDLMEQLKSAGVGMVQEQGLWQTKEFRPVAWPSLGLGYNAGMAIFHLKRLRNIWNWEKLWRQVVKEELINTGPAPTAGQEVLNAIVKRHLNIIHTLPCGWNLQLSQNVPTTECYEVALHDPYIVHFNSPTKLANKINKDVDHFREPYLEMGRHDESLLRSIQSKCQLNYFASSKRTTWYNWFIVRMPLLVLPSSRVGWIKVWTL